MQDMAMPDTSFEDRIDRIQSSHPQQKLAEPMPRARQVSKSTQLPTGVASHLLPGLAGGALGMFLGSIIEIGLLFGRAGETAWADLLLWPSIAISVLLTFSVFPAAMLAKKHPAFFAFSAGGSFGLVLPFLI